MKIEISLRAKNLKNVAGFGRGKSDPFAVLTLLSNNVDMKPKVLGKTEVIRNNLSPDFATTFQVDYSLGESTNLLVNIFDYNHNLKHVPMASAVFDVGSILGARGNTKCKEVKGGGKIYARVETSNGTGTLKLALAGIKLKNFDGLFNKSDPFYVIARKEQGALGTEWDVVFRSPVVKNNLNPTWNVQDIDLSVLCKGDLSREIRLELYDHESSGKHILMGRIETNVNAIIKAAGGEGFHLMKDGKSTGTLAVLNAELCGVEKEEQLVQECIKNLSIQPSAPPLILSSEINRAPTFADYISGGCEINLTVAIDFTGSNGDPRKPGTLHYFHPDGSMNDYQKAILSIASILSNYDSDQKYPVLGFGAKYNNVVQHCFRCGPSDEVDGVQGILNAYKDVFRSGLIMSGPTVFTEVMQTAAATAMSNQQKADAIGKQAYTILLILTDGSVSDVDATARCINQIKDAPLSIVIVGLGQADFSSMKFLDDHSSDIDITQFVVFDQHKHSSTSLTRATLDEIPSQLEAYFQRHGIMPNPPIQVEEEEIIVDTEEEEIDLRLDFGNDSEISVLSGGMYMPRVGY